MRRLNLMLAAIWRLAPNLNIEIGFLLGATRLRNFADYPKVFWQRGTQQAPLRPLNIQDKTYLLHLILIIYLI